MYIMYIHSSMYHLCLLVHARLQGVDVSLSVAVNGREA